MSTSLAPAKICLFASRVGYLPFSSSFSSATGWTWPAGAGDGEGGASDPEVKVRGGEISLLSGL